MSPSVLLTLVHCTLSVLRLMMGLCLESPIGKKWSSALYGHIVYTVSLQAGTPT